MSSAQEKIYSTLAKTAESKWLLPITAPIILSVFLLIMYYPIFISIGIGRMLNTEVLGWLILITLIISYGAAVIYEQDISVTKENEKQQNILMYVEQFATVFLLTFIGIVFYRQFGRKTKTENVLAIAVAFTGIYILQLANQYFNVAHEIGKRIKDMK